MDSIAAKPYKLFGKIQNYDWGTKNENAYIPKFLGIDAEENVPYAEYWIGIHPKAPSEILIDNKKVLLTEILAKHPSEILGNRIIKEFGNTLPFLLKILSVNQALSIQAHPNKLLAEELHSKDPINYPDDNHKPEIAIAVDQLQAIVGFKKIAELKTAIEKYFEIQKLVDPNLLEKINKLDKVESEEWIKEFYKNIMSSSDDLLEECITDIKIRLENIENRKQAEEQFLLQYKNYGIDVGLLSILLFNFINLKSDEAIFTPAGIPHAYIKGNIIECMANSDNVIRAGLTPKYKDLETLTKMLSLNSDETMVKKVEDHEKIRYRTSAKEFEIQKLKLDKKFITKNNDEMSIIFLTDGEIEIATSNKNEKYARGDVILIPSVLSDYEIWEILPSQTYRALIP